MRGNGRGEREWRGDGKEMGNGSEGKAKENWKNPYIFIQKIQGICRKKQNDI